MPGGNGQRVYLTCGSVLLLVFSFAIVIAIATLGSGDQPQLLAAIALVATVGILLFNATLLCGTNGGPKVLAAAKVLLWFSFLLAAVAIAFCIASMVGIF
jgi:hypothetical protein